ncbi:hypothetical protein AB0N05_33170 [Nocardia sp. NPDC051030]|uniref:hypothetical protein n=1 Tax=Nocardia sp. NPDC051030 TaxID=3155162 RepID=UPI003427C88A
MTDSGLGFQTGGSGRGDGAAIDDEVRIGDVSGVITGERRGWCGRRPRSIWKTGRVGAQGGKREWKYAFDLGGIDGHAAAARIMPSSFWAIMPPKE